MHDDPRTVSQVADVGLAALIQSPRYQAALAEAQQQRRHPQPRPRFTPPDKPLQNYSDEELALSVQHCDTCRGFGFVRRDVDVLDPDFGKVFQCSACGPFQQERRRRKVLQAMQPLMDAYSMLEGELLGKTFKNFELAPRVQAAHKAVRSWALAIYRDEVTKPFLYLFGPTGVGKSHLGAAAANALVSTHTSVMFTTFTELLGMLSADNYRHKERGIKAMQDIPVLILDDIRAGDLTSDWSTNVLFRVLDRRVVTQKATLLISNHPVTSDDLDMPSLRDYEPRVASRLSDRRLCRWVPVIAEDYRVSGDHTDT